MPRKLTESKRFAVCGRKCDVEQVAEAYLLKRDHPKFKGNRISATGASKSECRETHRVKAFRRLRKEVSIHAQEGSPEIQRQVNFSNWGIEKHTCSRGITRNSKATEFRQPGHRSQNAAKLTESYRFAVCGSECDVEPVAEAYMLKRDHQKLKGNRISATGASKSECQTNSRSIHAQEGSPEIQRQVNFSNWGIEKHTCSRGITRNSKATEFRQPGHRSRNAAKLTESKRFAVSVSEVLCRTNSRSIHAQEGSPEIQRQLNFGNWGIEVGMPRNSRSQSVSLFAKASEIRNAAKLIESKRFAVCGRKCDVEQVAEAYMLKRDHQKFKGNRISANGASKAECRETHRVKALRPLRKEEWASKSECRETHPVKALRPLRKEQPGNRSRNAAKLTESNRFAVCGSECDVEPVAEAYMLKRDHQKFKGNRISATGASKSECRETHRVKAFRPLRKEVWCRTSSRSIHAQEGSPEIQRQLNFGNRGIEKHTCSRGITRNSKATEFRQPGHRSRNAAKLTESKRFAVCVSECDVERVAEAYMLKRDHPKFKGNRISSTGHRSRNAAKTHESKRFAVCGRKRNAAKLIESKRFAVCGRKCDVEQVAEAYMLKRDHPKFKGNCNFGNRGIEVGMPRNSSSQSVTPFCGRKCGVEQVAEKHTCSRGITRNSKATEFRQPGQSKSECRETHESKRFRCCGRKCDVEQVAEAYMLKRDHPKIQRQLNFGNGASKSECRETHVVKALRCLRKRVRNAAKLTESKRFAVCGKRSECRETHESKRFAVAEAKCDVEQVAEAYMLKRDHPKFKGN
ncbi:hypothetical protein D5086_003557 [Populus alba]|uniref:Uncharacterized protein n=1 Tax=Populus alba TaxID=43335 RepID=A0ACC4D6M0_POPAL